MLRTAESPGQGAEESLTRKQRPGLWTTMTGCLSNGMDDRHRELNQQPPKDT